MAGKTLYNHLWTTPGFNNVTVCENPSVSCNLYIKMSQTFTMPATTMPFYFSNTFVISMQTNKKPECGVCSQLLCMKQDASALAVSSRLGRYTRTFKICHTSSYVHKNQ